jgi:hypothetical protein
VARDAGDKKYWRQETLAAGTTGGSRYWWQEPPVAGALGPHSFQPRLFQQPILSSGSSSASAVLNLGTARRTDAARRKRPVGEREGRGPPAGPTGRILPAGSRWAGPLGAFLAEVGPPPEKPLPENPRLEISSRLENPRLEISSHLEVGYRLEVGSRLTGRLESSGSPRRPWLPRRPELDLTLYDSERYHNQALPQAAPQRMLQGGGLSRTENASGKMSDPNEALQERALGLTPLRKIQQKLKGPEPKLWTGAEIRDRS